MVGVYWSSKRPLRKRETMELLPTLEAPSTTMRYEFLAGTLKVQFPLDKVFIMARGCGRERGEQASGGPDTALRPLLEAPAPSAWLLTVSHVPVCKMGTLDQGPSQRLWSSAHSFLRTLVSFLLHPATHSLTHSPPYVSQHGTAGAGSLASSLTHCGFWARSLTSPGATFLV